MQKSDILGLNLPDLDDKYNIEDFNENFRTLDAEGKKTDANTTNIELLQQTIQNQQKVIKELQQTIKNITDCLGDVTQLANMLYTRNVSTILTDESGDSVLTHDGEKIEVYFTLKAE